MVNVKQTNKMSSEIKHNILNEDVEITESSEVNDKQVGGLNSQNNIPPENQINKDIVYNKLPVSNNSTINNPEPNLIDYNVNINNSKSNMDKDYDMNQKIILDDTEIGKPYGKPENKRNSDMVSLQKNEEKNEEPSLQRKIAGGLIGSVKTTFTNSFENCLYNIPKYGRPYFEVNTQIIKERLLQGVNPHKNQLYETTKDSPDLYGPFWIYTSVVFCLAASGSVYQYINGSGTKTPTTFAEFVSVTSFWIYLIGFIFPLAIYALLKYTGSNISYVQALCIYGYTFSVFIPVSVICVFFGAFFDWLVLLYAGASSSYLLIKAYSNFFTDKIDKNKKYVFLGLVAVVQLFLILFLRYYFFNAPAVVAVVSKVNSNTSNSSSVDTKTSSTKNSSNSNKTGASTASSNSMVINPDDYSSLEKSIKQAEESSKKSQEKTNVNSNTSSSINTNTNSNTNTITNSDSISKETTHETAANNELDNLAKEYENKDSKTPNGNHTI